MTYKPSYWAGHIEYYQACDGLWYVLYDVVLPFPSPSWCMWLIPGQEDKS